MAIASSTEPLGEAVDAVGQILASYQAALTLDGTALPSAVAHERLGGADAGPLTAVASILAAAAMAAPAITRVSVSSDGEQVRGGGQLGAMTPDGRFFVFMSRTRRLAPATAPAWTASSAIAAAGRPL